jgi:hypothetical protein
VGEDGGGREGGGGGGLVVGGSVCVVGAMRSGLRVRDAQEDDDEG